MIRPLPFDAGPPDSPPDPPEPDGWDEVEPDRCPGCESLLDEGCPRNCPERALDEDAEAYFDRCRD